jgi:hypothetical protein
MFSAVSEYTLFIFAACNVLTIPMVYCLYPEVSPLSLPHPPRGRHIHILTKLQTNQRTLEEMNLLFAADTPWVWDAERNYRILVEENPDLVQAARRGSMAAGDLEEQLRKGSVASQGERRRVSLAVRGGGGGMSTVDGEKGAREVRGEK